MSVQGPWVLSLVQGWLSGKTLHGVLLDPASAEDIDHDNISDLVELIATGYPPGGVPLTGVVASYDPIVRQVVIDCDDIDFGSMSSTNIAGIAFVDHATGALIGIDFFDSEIDTIGTGFTYLVNEVGIVALKPTPVTLIG